MAIQNADHGACDWPTGDPQRMSLLEILLFLTQLMSNHRVDVRKRDQDAALMDMLRQLPSTLDKARNSPEGKKLLELAQQVAQQMARRYARQYGDSRMLYSDLAQEAEKHLTAAIENLRQAGDILDRFVKASGKSRFTWNAQATQFERLADRVPPGQIVTKLDQVSHLALSSSMRTKQALEYELAVHIALPWEPVAPIPSQIALPIITDELVAITFPPEGRSDMYHHTRYILKRLGDLANKLKRSADEFDYDIANARKSHHGADLSFILAMTATVLEYSARIHATCEKLCSMAATPPPTPHGIFE